ncbi:MAG: hypothetical protein ACFFD7_10590 [Candidatus Thorarchaeota archaeon]
MVITNCFNTNSISYIYYIYSSIPTSPYIGSGALDGTGIPTDFVSDLNVRKAFAYVFDYEFAINLLSSGEAI